MKTICVTVTLKIITELFSGLKWIYKSDCCSDSFCAVPVLCGEKSIFRVL